MTERTLKNLFEFNNFVKSNKAAVVYFSTPDCSVCKVLKPKFKELLGNNFPEIKFAYVNISEAKEIAGQNTVFTVPTILFIFEGKELLRKSRNVNLGELSRELFRFYSLMFDG